MDDDGRFSQLLDTSTKLIVIMVGLPARGKSFMAKKIHKYMEHLGVQCKIFNLGSYRRLYTKTETVGKASSNFFDPANQEASKLREQCCSDALADLVEFLKNGGQAAIFDGTNSTCARRARINSFFEQKNREGAMKFDCVYVESICHDESVIRHNIVKSKLKNPDYCTVAEQTAIDDFYRRIEQYEKQYREVLKDEGSFIKIIDVGNEVVGHAINNYLALRVLYFVMHLNLNRKLFIRSESIVAKLDQMANPGASTEEEPSKAAFVPPPWTRRASFLFWKDVESDPPADETTAAPATTETTAAIYKSPSLKPEAADRSASDLALSSSLRGTRSLPWSASTPISGGISPMTPSLGPRKLMHSRVSRRDLLVQKINDPEGTERQRPRLDPDEVSANSLVPRELIQTAPDFCTMAGCGNEFTDDYPPHVCQLCNRIVCESCCNNEVPVDGNPDMMLRVCEVCIYETDSDSEPDEAESEFFIRHAGGQSVPEADAVTTFRQQVVSNLNSILEHAESSSKEDIVEELRRLRFRFQKEAELSFYDTQHTDISLAFPDSV